MEISVNIYLPFLVSIAITDYPTTNTLWCRPGSITAGPEEAIWFTGFGTATTARNYNQRRTYGVRYSRPHRALQPA
jgi:hypothetical protein